MPTFIYLITGLSQVMCSFEIIMKFKNLETNESQDKTSTEKTEIVKKNSQILKVLYLGLGFLMVIILLSFLLWVAICGSMSTD